MAGPLHQKDRVVQGVYTLFETISLCSPIYDELDRGREVATLGQTDAHSVEDDSSHRWTDSDPVSGAVPEALGRGGSKGERRIGPRGTRRRC